MENIQAENVRELVLVLLERMRVMDISILELKGHVSSKTDAEIVARLEKEVSEIKATLMAIQKKQEDEELVRKTNEEQKEKDKQENMDTVKWISVLAGIALTLYILFKNIFQS